MDLRQRALELLLVDDPASKAQGTRALYRSSVDRQAVPLDTEAVLQCKRALPGRPLRPRLVEPKSVPTRSVHTLAGRAGLLHAVAHIEFNAINLALDAVWRFAGMPEDFYRDWLRVAAEEAHHFGLLNEHLGRLGHTYGDFDAHDGLWQMCERTRDDVVARMALVPRVLEARGLDATPPMQDKLRRAGDVQAVAILDIILRDEVGHVAIGNRWFHWLCAQRGLAPIPHEQALRQRYAPPPLRPPLNVAARRAAGFSEAELDLLLGSIPRAPGAEP